MDKMINYLYFQEKKGRTTKNTLAGVFDNDHINEACEIIKAKYPEASVYYIFGELNRLLEV